MINHKIEYVCDRCGAKSEVRSGYQEIITDRSSLSIRRIDFEEEYHLCPACMVIFYEFVKGEHHAER